MCGTQVGRVGLVRPVEEEPPTHADIRQISRPRHLLTLIDSTGQMETSESRSFQPNPVQGLLVKVRNHRTPTPLVSGNDVKFTPSPGSLKAPSRAIFAANVPPVPAQFASVLRSFCRLRACMYE